MIIGDNRERVITNIKKAVQNKDFTAKAEVGDPDLTTAQRKALVDKFWQRQTSWTTHFHNFMGQRLLSTLATCLSHSTTLVGADQLHPLLHQGAVITANHFNQLDALAIKRLAQKVHQPLKIVIEDTNLVLPGFLSYIMNYIGTIPLFDSPSYLMHQFPRHLDDAFKAGQWVLIFPEQEMWWNYRKPRPLQRGAYYYAARANVPVISTFVEIQSLPQLEKKDPAFHQTKYIVHVLPTIYPDPKLSVDENSRQMCHQDYQQKVQAYQSIYNKPLDYTFTNWDIAGWTK